MTRTLKILVAAVLAMTAFGAVSAVGAQAADEFHCSVNPCRLTAKQDGTVKTAHQVLLIENAARTEVVNFTCHEFAADAELTGITTTEFTLTNVQNKNCTVNGSPGAVTWDMNGCDYRFAAGTPESSWAGTVDLAWTHLVCPGANKMQITIPIISCTFEIGPHTMRNAGYHTIGTEPNREITLTLKGADTFTVTASAGCVELIKPSQSLYGTRTTANFILTGETPEGVMADAWFA